MTTLPESVMKQVAEACGWRLDADCDRWYRTDEYAELAEWQPDGSFRLTPAGCFCVIEKFRLLTGSCFGEEPGYWQIEDEADNILGWAHTLTDAIHAALVEIYS